MKIIMIIIMILISNPVYAESEVFRGEVTKVSSIYYMNRVESQEIIMHTEEREFIEFSTKDVKKYGTEKINKGDYIQVLVDSKETDTDKFPVRVVPKVIASGEYSIEYGYEPSVEILDTQGNIIKEHSEDIVTILKESEPVVNIDLNRIIKLRIIDRGLDRFIKIRG